MVLMYYTHKGTRLADIVEGRKVTTTRRDALGRLPDMFEKGLALDQHWTNPRACSPEHYKIGVAVWEGYSMKTGFHFTEQDAIRDGFGWAEDPLSTYINTLALLHNISCVQVENIVWIINEWETWIDGPHHPPEGSPAWRHFPQGRVLA